MVETLRESGFETAFLQARRPAAEGPAVSRTNLKRLHDEMLSAVVRGEPLEDVVRVAAAAAGAPVMVVIPDRIATVVTPGTGTNAALVSLEGWVRERASGRPAAVRDEVIAEVPVMLGERAVGVVGIAGDGQAPSSYAHWVLDVAAAVVATAVAIDEARIDTEHAIRGSFLEQLRAGEELSRDQIVRRAARLGCDLSAGAVVLCVDVAGNRPRLIATMVADEYPGAFAEVVDRATDEPAPQVWALLPARAAGSAAPHSEQEVEEAAKRVAARLRQHGAVGISRFHPDVGELHGAIDEAELMLEVARRVASPSGDEIVDGTYKLLFRLLASHPEELRSYHETTIAPLVVHDDQYRTDLVRTLEAYLDTNCNMNLAAELVFAHRHTVAHRLERISELTGLDATQHEDRERLGLGLKIHRLTA